MTRVATWVAAVVLSASVASSAGAVSLGGRDVPKDKFIVYLFIGHSNMAGRVDDIESETYETHPRAWNYKFDDGSTNAWIPAQPPVHRDVCWQRGGGPATPFLKRMVELYPGYYVGVIQNAHSSVEIVNDYRRGKPLYDEIVNLTLALKSDFTLGGVVAMLGAMEGANQTWANDFGNQLSAMMAELRQDLGEPNLPLLINRLTKGNTYWQAVQNGIVSCTSSDPWADIVPSDGPYKPGDNTHYTWVGHKAWGQAVGDLIVADGWFPGSAADDNFAPLIARIKAVGGSTVEVVFGEYLDSAAAQTPGNYSFSPTVNVTNASLAGDQKTVTLTTAAMTSGTNYTLSVSGVQDVSGNAAPNLIAQFTYIFTDIPYTNLQLWLRSDKGVVKDSVDHVPLWIDQSGNGNDVIKARFNNQPWYCANAIKGKPAVRFNELGLTTIYWPDPDNENDWLERTLPATYTGDSTLFLVFRVNVLGQPANRSIFNSSDQSGGSNATFQIEVDGGNPGNLQLYSDTPYVIGPTTTNWQLFTARIAGTNLSFYVDGTSSGSCAIGSSEAKTYTHYYFGRNRGGSEFLECEIAEALLYHHALSTTDRQKVEQYLGGKYGLTAVPSGITVMPTGGLSTTEAGGTDLFTVVLDAAPTSNVTIPLSSSDPGEGAVSTSSLTFTTSNWDAPQTVTVTGVDDAQSDGNVAYTVVLGLAASSDSDYGGLDPTDVLVTNMDDDGVVNQPPQAVIVGPAVANVGIAVSYYGGNSTDDGVIVSYHWDFGDGSTDTGQLVNHSWTAPGVYTVTLTVTDDGGVQAQKTLDVDVSPTIQPSITILSPVGGETWVAGTTQSIRWTTTDLDDVQILFSDDGGSNWQVIGYCSVSDQNWGDFRWDVPGVASTECIILIQGYYFEVPTQSGLFEIRGIIDTDADGMDDDWELANFGSLNQDGAADSDGDGMSDLEEYLNGTDPTVSNVGGGDDGTGLGCAAGGASLLGCLALVGAMLGLFCRRLLQS